MTPLESRQQLGRARRFAREHGYATQIESCRTNHDVLLTLIRPVEERDAATEFVRRMELVADEWDDEYGPMWLGHALHRAFLAGIEWAKQKDES